MTPRDFAYWLQGYMEVHGTTPTDEQWQVIQDHLKLVFVKVTPDRQKAKPHDEDVKKSPLDIDFDEILKRTQRDNDKWPTPTWNPYPPYEVTCSNDGMAFCISRTAC